MSRNPSVSLTAHQQAFVESLVAGGRFHGVSEVVRAGLRLLEEQEERRRARVAMLERAVEEGLASGEPSPMESAEALLGRFRAKAQSAK